MTQTAKQIPEGHYSNFEKNWLLYPLADRKDHGTWIEIGSAGVDGIVFSVQKDKDGIYAYYPIDREFIWKADDLRSLIEGWNSGQISV